MAAHGRFTESAAKQRLVHEVQFGVLSPDEIVGIIAKRADSSRWDEESCCGRAEREKVVGSATLI